MIYALCLLNCPIAALPMNVMRRNDVEDWTNAGNLPEVAVVILNWNGKKFLEKFLPSVLASTYKNMRLVVADNASTDDSVLYLKANFPSVEIIIHTSNEGFAKGYNTALAQIKSDYYVLLNSDIEVKQDWLEPLMYIMEKNKNIGACQPKILSYHHKNTFEYAGACGGWIDAFGYPFSRGRVFDDCEEDKGQYEDAAACFWATGAALCIRSRLYHDAGGLDPYFFAHQEEIDLCWRIQRLGFDVFAVPLSVVYHVGGGTLPKGNSRKTFLNFRNNLIMLHKNMPWAEKSWKLPVRMGLDAVAAWRALLSGDAVFFMAVGKAHFHYMKWLFTGDVPALPFKKRKYHGWYKGMLIWQYFIKKKRKFSEIVVIK